MCSFLQAFLCLFTFTSIPVSWTTPPPHTHILTIWCLSQARTWITIVCCGSFFVCSKLRWEAIVCFVDIGGIVDHYCLTFFCFVDIGGIVDHYCLNLLLFCWYRWNCWPLLFNLLFIKNTISLQIFRFFLSFHGNTKIVNEEAFIKITGHIKKDINSP